MIRHLVEKKIAGPDYWAGDFLAFA